MKLIVPKKYVVSNKIETDKQIVLYFPTYSKRVKLVYTALNDYIKLDFATREDNFVMRYIVSDMANKALELSLDENVENVKIKFVLINQEFNNRENNIPILPLPFGIKLQKGYYKIGEGFISHIIMRRLLVEYLKNINPLDFVYLAHRIIQIVED